MYLSNLTETNMRSFEDTIRFSDDHPDLEFYPGKQTQLGVCSFNAWQQCSTVEQEAPDQQSLNNTLRKDTSLSSLSELYLPYGKLPAKMA